MPVNCAYCNPSYTKSYISVKFRTAGKISIPLTSLVSQFADKTCRSFIKSCGDVLSTIGNPFLRGVYSIFDQENFTITLGQVKHTDKEDIVLIPEGGFKAS
jgi:hypothetical protein